MEHPIIFNGEMVRAILDGRKTQTRRVVKHQDAFDVDEIACVDPDGDVWQPHPGIYPPHGSVLTPSGKPLRCPYGVVGDTLWVKETFRHYGNSCPGSTKTVIAGCEYRADEAVLHRGSWPDFDSAPKEKWWNTGTLPWAPSIFMPRWASRITLEITNIRVERVQDITVPDCIAEGIDHGADTEELAMIEAVGDGDDRHKEQFADLWDSINAKPKRVKTNPLTLAREDCYVAYPWEDIRKTETLKSGLKVYTIGNPWVWPIDFKERKHA